MSEWLYEAGIGEARAALVADGRIVAGRLEIDHAQPRVGAVLPGRLTAIVAGGREGRIGLARGGEVIVAPLPVGITEGAALSVEIVREAIPEPGRTKLPRGIPAAPGAILGDGPDLLARIKATGVAVRRCLPHQPDALEAAGWSELIEEAADGEIGFGDGVLRMTPTPAMTLFDVDGSAPLAILAVAAARAVAQAILRHDIGGSIGIDFPTLAGKAQRQAVAAALDAVLPPPFERTAMNGFGFLQIIRRRRRPSLPEMIRADPVGAAARALLRQIARTPPPVPERHRVSAGLRVVLDAHPGWTAELARVTGRHIAFEEA